TEHGPRSGLQVTVNRNGGRAPKVARWGGVSLARDITPRPLGDNPARVWSGRWSELVQRLLAEVCELCGSGQQVEVHHVRALKDPNPKGRKRPPARGHAMASRHRKTLVIYPICHEDIHARRPHTAATIGTGGPDATETGHIRFRGAVGKGPGH